MKIEDIYENPIRAFKTILKLKQKVFFSAKTLLFQAYKLSIKLMQIFQGKLFRSIKFCCTIMKANCGSETQIFFSILYWEKMFFFALFEAQKVFRQLNLINLPHIDTVHAIHSLNIFDMANKNRICLYGNWIKFHGIENFFN